MVERTSQTLPLADAQQPISGVVERVTFHNEENGFSVLRVRVEGRRELATVVGRAARVAAGEWLQARGRWEQDRVHGPQFRAEELAVSAPSTREGAQRFLGSGVIHGVGPGLAERLIDAFGDDVFRVIDEHPERLSEVRGVGRVRAERIVAGWGEQQRVREIMVFLHSHGVGTARALRIHRRYGANAIASIRSDPYRLARDIRGIGFATADALARELGVAPDAPSRRRAGVRHVLSEALSEGHCGLPREQVLETASALLDAPSAALEETLQGELDAGELVAESVGDTPCVFLPALDRAERASARLLARLAQGRPPWPEIDPAKALPWVEAKLEVALADSQREALAKALGQKVLLLTGGPGVGKTTLVNALLTILAAKQVDVALAAPTGRAARRLAEATGRDASTVHRLLETDPGTGGFKRNERHPLECELLVVDESSMLDVPLLHALLRAVPTGAAVVFVGDVDQLPSVGPGRVLADIIDSGAVPVVRLVEVFRQAAESRIVQVAHEVNRGVMPDLTTDADSDFFFVEVEDPDLGVERILSLVSERIPRRFRLDPLADIQVLSPMHRGSLGARNLNIALQAALNPGDGERPSVERFGWTYAAGDKVMQVENDYEREVYNGDVGFVKSVDLEGRELVIAFEGREVLYGFDELDCIALAYATTVHKAQGSEYPAVVMAVTTQHYPMLARNLIYTGITRGKRLVILVGQRKALSLAVEGRAAPRRWSKLADWLRAESVVAGSGAC